MLKGKFYLAEGGYSVESFVSRSIYLKITKESKHSDFNDYHYLYLRWCSEDSTDNPQGLGLDVGLTPLDYEEVNLKHQIVNHKDMIKEIESEF